jgi:hypothetical protein
VRCAFNAPRLFNPTPPQATHPTPTPHLDVDELGELVVLRPRRHHLMLDFLVQVGQDGALGVLVGVGDRGAGGALVQSVVGWAYRGGEAASRSGRRERPRGQQRDERVRARCAGGASECCTQERVCIPSSVSPCPPRSSCRISDKDLAGQGLAGRVRNDCWSCFGRRLEVCR